MAGKEHPEAMDFSRTAQAAKTLKIWDLLESSEPQMVHTPRSCRDSTNEPFTVFGLKRRVVLEQHLGEG
jgi:hypothetical protein